MTRRSLVSPTLVPVRLDTSRGRMATVIHIDTTKTPIEEHRSLSRDMRRSLDGPLAISHARIAVRLKSVGSVAVTCGVPLPGRMRHFAGVVIAAGEHVTGLIRFP